MISNPQYSKAVPIVTSNTVNFVNQGNSDGLADAIFCGTGGIAQVVMQDDSVVAFTLIAGQILPVQCKRVNVLNTTAALMVALYAI